MESVLFILPITTGPILVIAGYILIKKPPKEINQLYGYRTHLAMKSQAHWDFAQAYSAKRMMFWGVVYTLSSLLAFIIELDIKTELFLGFVLCIGFILIPIVETQKALKKKFNENENN